MERQAQRAQRAGQGWAGEHVERERQALPAGRRRQPRAQGRRGRQRRQGVPCNDGLRPMPTNAWTTAESHGSLTWLHTRMAGRTSPSRRACLLTEDASETADFPAVPCRHSTRSQIQGRRCMRSGGRVYVLLQVGRLRRELD